MLSALLVPERYRQRAATGSGFSVPVMSEREVPPTAQPIFVTTTRGGFTTTFRNREGYARFGFSLVPIDQESLFLWKMFESLWAFSEQCNWGNRFSSLRDARESLVQPKSLVVSEDIISNFDRSSVGGKVGEYESLSVFSAKFPPGIALLATDPVSFGVYMRVGDYLGLQLFRINQTVSLVRSNGLAQ